MSLESEFPEYVRAERELVAPGAPFELVVEEVLGAKLPVFKNRLRDLRQVLERSRSHGDLEYVVYEDRRVSFEQNYRTVASAARALSEIYGVGPGDRVAILAANCPEWIASWWAAVSLGAIGVGMNGWWVEDEIRFALDDCRPKVLIGDARRLERLGGADLGIPTVEIESGWEALASHAPDAGLPDAPIEEDDPASILYTSGTTGRPKGAVNTHRAILAVLQVQALGGARKLRLAAARGERPGAEPAPRTTMLVNAPLFHLSGLYANAVAFLANGLKIVMSRGRFDPEKVLQLIERERVTTWSPMTAMLFRVARHPDLHRYDLSSMRTIGTGGERTSPEMLRLMRETFPTARGSVSLGYGLTEHTCSVTTISDEMLERYPASVGPIVPSVEVELRDARGRAVPAGQEGEIFVRSAMVMLGYWERPEANAETLGPGRWLGTGDVGHLDENGLLYIHSRKRDMIIRGGENVYPVEIEMRLQAHPHVAEAAVLGVDHPELGQEVKAVVVPEPGAALDPDALAAWVGETLAYFKVPTLWEERREPLPRNASSKLMKDQLAGEAPARFVEE